jgi:hypothetical protein
MNEFSRDGEREVTLLPKRLRCDEQIHDISLLVGV